MFMLSGAEFASFVYGGCCMKKSVIVVVLTMALLLTACGWSDVVLTGGVVAATELSEATEELSVEMASAVVTTEAVATESPVSTEKPLAEKVDDLQELVQAYAWSDYQGGYLAQKEAYAAAYAEAAASFVSNHDKAGNDCGVFVLILMRNSGWDKNYPDARTAGQYEYLSNPENGWIDITTSIRSNDDALPGDVIITRGKGHVVVYVGNVPGFGSVMASASYGRRAPMADRSNDIMEYVVAEWGHDHREYAVFRKAG